MYRHLIHVHVQKQPEVSVPLTQGEAAMTATALKIESEITAQSSAEASVGSLWKISE